MTNTEFAVEVSREVVEHAGRHALELQPDGVYRFFEGPGWVELEVLDQLAAEIEIRLIDEFGAHVRESRFRLSHFDGRPHPDAELLDHVEGELVSAKRRAIKMRHA